jgi:aspartate racemase
MMKKIGIIGGIGPESTVDYYKRIIDAFKTKGIDSSYPEIIIYSVNLAELMSILEEGNRSKLVDWLVDKTDSLFKAGAAFAVIGSNTPHVVYDEVRSRSPIPMLSIVEETRNKVLSLGLKKPGLMGTKFTMESDFFIKPFSRQGISVILPEKEDQELIHHRLFAEIELGIIKDSTREELLAIVRRMIGRHSIDSLILGCTELPLILTGDKYGIPFLNTTAIHAESVVKYCLR